MKRFLTAGIAGSLVLAGSVQIAQALPCKGKFIIDELITTSNGTNSYLYKLKITNHTTYRYAYTPIGNGFGPIRGGRIYSFGNLRDHGGLAGGASRTLTLGYGTVANLSLADVPVEYDVTGNGSSKLFVGVYDCVLMK